MTPSMRFLLYHVFFVDTLSRVPDKILVGMEFNGQVNIIPVLNLMLKLILSFSPSWISRREKIWLQKISHDQSPWKNVAGPCRDQTNNLITSKKHIWLSHWIHPDYEIQMYEGHLKWISNWSSALQKQAYSNILKISPPKTENFQIKNFELW